MIRITCFIALFALAAAASLSYENEWNSFKAKHNRSYASKDEEALRKQVFFDNLRMIKNHNEQAENGVHTYRLGVNKFADLTYEEFKAQYLTYQRRSRRSSNVHKFNATVKVADSVDWRDEGVVTGVKDQANCGSCWAFSAVAAIESANALATGNLVSLSEQNLIECSSAYGNEGCNGGLMDSSFEYVIDNGGIDTEDSYPYTSASGSSSYNCKYSSSNKGASISSYVDVQSGSESALESAVAQQPTSVAIDAEMDLQLYSSGILKSSICSAYSLNHGVTAVGYGTENGTPYWIIKNSWGSDFGEDGYFRLYRGSNNCGVATEASYPVV